MSWNRLTKAFTTTPPELAQQLAGLPVPVDPSAAMNSAWRATGGVGGPLGDKQGGQYPVGADAVAQNFAHGKIFFSPLTGANALESDVLAKYESLGGPVGSDLGYPTANEANGGLTNSRVATFNAADKPVIFWTPGHGAFVVRGALKTAWDKLGGAKGKLGAPVGDQAVHGAVVTQAFTGGKVSWDRTKNAYTTDPPSLASLLSQLPGPESAEPCGFARRQDRPRGIGGGFWSPCRCSCCWPQAAFITPRRPARRAATAGPAVVETEGNGAPAPVEEAGSETGGPWPEDIAGDEVTSQLLQHYRDPQAVRPTPARPVSRVQFEEPGPPVWVRRSAIHAPTTRNPTSAKTRTSRIQMPSIPRRPASRRRLN